MMTLPGFALFYAGMVRKKNVLATMAQSIAATAIVSMLWMVAGYSLAFSGDGALIGTLDRLVLHGMGIDAVSPFAPTIPECLFTVYQMTFAIITVALVAGSVADRMRFSAFCCSRPCGCSSSMCRSRTGCGAAASSRRWRARLRRRHGRAHQCRRRGPRGGAGARPHAAATVRTISRRSICRSRWSAPGSCGSAGSASTAARRFGAIRAPCSRSSRPISPPARRAHLDGRSNGARAASLRCSA